MLLAIYASKGPRNNWINFFIVLQVVSLLFNLMIGYSYVNPELTNYNFDRFVYNVTNYVILAADYFVLMGMVNGTSGNRNLAT